MPWTPPPPNRDEMKYVVATSSIEEFAAGHDFAAVLRELAQNEFDAGGRRFEVLFERDGLRIRGTGKAIDSAGWERLSVISGTGRIAGTDRFVDEKPNGIGSKNFGIRSLFSIGDTIHIRSGGRYQALDCTAGTYPQIKPDADSRGRAGVEIWVPFRTSDGRILSAFTVRRERAALDGLATGLSGTLLKLAVPGKAHSLEQVCVRSERVARTLAWSQRALQVPSGGRGQRLTRREVRIEDSERRADKIEELEFRRAIPLPPRFVTQEFPAYFRRPPGRVLVAISLRVQRKKLDTSASGTWFYPIGVDRGYTGNAVSVCAPFEMDNDRTAILPTTDNEWNEWLAEQAAILTVDALRHDLWHRFGGDAYAAVWPTDDASDDTFRKRLEVLMRDEAVWPTRAPLGSRRQHFAPARSIVVPEHPAFDDFLEASRYAPSEALDRSGFRSALLAAGAQRFTLDSLVYLRCRIVNGPELHTRIQAGVARCHFEGNELHQPEIQARFAEALDAFHRRLSMDNRRDLRAAATTLAADGGLRPAHALKRVSPEVWEGCPESLAGRLHPTLLGSVFMQAVVPAFKPLVWGAEVAARAVKGEARPAERRALYSFLRASGGKLPVNFVAALRTAPVLRDAAGEWTRPVELIKRNTPGARAFAPVLRFPHRDIAKDAQLLRAFRVRGRLRPEDLLTYARLVAEQPQRAGEFEALLKTYRRFVSDSVAKKLSAIPFMRTATGGVAAPKDLYLDTLELRACLGPHAAYAAGALNQRLQSQLGCRSKPGASDMLAYVRKLASSGGPPPNLEQFYTALVPALTSANLKPHDLSCEPILWTGSSWGKPADTLLGTGHGRVFGGAVPVVALGSPAVAAAFERLGASRSPQPRHWHALLSSLVQRFGSERSMPDAVRHAVRLAYAHLGQEIAGIPPSQPLLLGRDGRLYRRMDAAAGRFVVVDDPAMATAIETAGVPIGLADDREPRSLRFYSSCGVRTLRELRSLVRFKFVGERPAPPRLRVDDLLDTLHAQWRASALAAMVAHRLRRTGVRPPRTEDLTRRLRGIKDFAFVREIWATYRIGGHRVAVPTEMRLDGDRLILARARARAEVIGALADTIALWLPEVPGVDWADSVFRLLSCDDPRACQAFLQTRGISWRPPSKAEGASGRDEVDEAVSDALGPLFSDVDSEVPPEPSPKPGPKSSKRRPKPPLPALDQVRPRMETADNGALPPRVDPGGNEKERRRRHRNSIRDEERDQVVGRRGEEIVLRAERERLRQAGLPAESAVWAAEIDPLADHDILSIGDDGKPVWIEVKATAGKDGRFRWSRAEFELAMRARDRYLLYRVYEADSLTPVVRIFRNPVARLVNDAIRLDVAVLLAELPRL